jgi:hypothetical protein
MFVAGALQLPLSECAVMIPEVILIMRIYALYERSKHVLAFMIVVTFAAAAFALVSCFTDNLLLKRGSQGNAVYINNDGEASRHTGLPFKGTWMSFADPHDSSAVIFLA